ncbi:D-TA family PLP-dependent enzyme [Mucilaginibacter terrenus]|uniref:D-TA family PLP-dependent enzyme n=1 Tax=Mucilaginibacter terrenus TaxID=2482727 RepID=A0A3E2NU14_9SPHI|nr:D-TA family PLP-dependent enzyme [Mucilaginibacter terrenus]RFZ84459.1 D-TA family PLP-dependent enzyme [Mucilaginibacter terrenus]
MATDWYTINNVAELDTPALVVYPERVQYNIDQVKGMVSDVSRLRPHIKTHKSPNVTAMMLNAGISKFKCATIAEAEMLGIIGAPDVLFAYQPNGPKLARFVKLLQTYPSTSYSCLVDNAATAQAISTAALSAGINVSVFIDLNVGMNRTGIVPRRAFELYQLLMNTRGIKLLGLHAYDGHIHDEDFSLREQRFHEAITPVLNLKEIILGAGYAPPIIIGGSSPTLPIAVHLEDIECSPGTFAYWDKGYESAFKEQHFQTAALVVGRIISLPDETKICIDIGHKSVSAENELSKRIYFLNAPTLSFVSQSEEHLVAEAGNGHTYQVGDVLYGLPYHICPTVAVYERAYIIENRQLKGEWLNTARDRKINI